MPEITPEQSNTLDALSQLVKGTSSSFSTSSSSQRSDTPSSKESSADKANRLRADKAAGDIKEASKLFNKSVKQNNKTSDQWKLQTEQSSKFLENAVTAVNQQSNLSASAFKGIEEAFNSEEQLKVMQEVREAFKDGRVVMDTELDRLKDNIERVGLDFSKLGIRNKKMADTSDMVNGAMIDIAHTGAILTKGNVKLDEQVTETTKGLKKASDGLDRLAKTAENSRKLTQGLMVGAAGTFKLFVDESRLAMSRGLADARDGFGDTAMMVAKLGISTSKYIELLGDNRQVQLAMQSAGKSWKDELVSMSNELMTSGFVGSMEEATLASAAFMKNTSMMGVAQNELRGAVKQQTKIYEQNFRALAISTSQFNALTEDMLNDVDIKKDLAKMQAKERQVYVESLQKRTAENVMMGYSIERAKELNKHFAKMSEEDPLQRLESAAKLRTGLGTIGMGNQGAEIQALMAKLPTLQGDEKIAAQEKITKVLAEAQSRFQELKGRDVGSNVAYGQLESQLGLKEILTMFQIELAEGRRIALAGESGAKARDKAAIAQREKEVHSTTAVAVRGVDTLQAGLSSSATFAATTGMVWLTGNGLKNGIGSMEKLLTSIAITSGMGGAGAGKLAKTAGKAALTAISGIGMGALAAGAAGAAAAYGAKQIYDLIESGGSTSGLYENLSDWFGLGDQGVGGWLYDKLNNNDDVDSEGGNSPRMKRAQKMQEQKDKEIKLKEDANNLLRDNNAHTKNLQKAILDGNAQRDEGNKQRGRGARNIDMNNRRSTMNDQSTSPASG